VPCRQILLDQLYTHFCREHESGVRTERRSLGRMVHHDHTDGAISEGEFMCFHLKEPHHLKEDHIEAVRRASTYDIAVPNVPRHRHGGRYCGYRVLSSGC
jgi:hypothetical protein